MVLKQERKIENSFWYYFGSSSIRAV